MPPHIGLKEYRLEIITSNQAGVETQDLWIDIPQNDIGETMPYVSFVGDINNDSIPDVIIQHSPSYAESTTHLFMSGYDGDKKPLQKWPNIIGEIASKKTNLIG